MKELLSNTRAQGTGISNYLLALLVGAIMIFIVNQITAPIFEQAKQAPGGTVGNASTSYMQAAVNNWPIIMLFTGFFSLVVLAIFQREVLR